MFSYLNGSATNGNIALLKLHVSASAWRSARENAKRMRESAKRPGVAPASEKIMRMSGSSSVKSFTMEGDLDDIDERAIE